MAVRPAPPVSDYVLGHGDGELRRLISQSALYAPFTEVLLQKAQIEPGMRVLDVGCGPGDVSLLAARRVGPAGHVTGLDRCSKALDLARRRVADAGLCNVDFSVGDLSDPVLGFEDCYDAVLGSFVLMYLPEPSAALRGLAGHVREGGVVAFQEMDISRAESYPEMPLWRNCRKWIADTFEKSNVDIRMGRKLYSTFRQAGLPGPRMILNARVEGGADTSACQYVADVVASLLPRMVELGIVAEAHVQIETLSNRLNEEMRLSDGVSILPSLIGAWAIKPRHMQSG